LIAVNSVVAVASDSLSVDPGDVPARDVGGAAGGGRLGLGLRRLEDQLVVHLEQHP